MLPTFETDRLILRSIDSGDLELLHRLSSNPEVLKFINGGKILGRSEVEKDLAKRLEATTDVFGYWMIHLKSNSEFIGWVALKPLDGGPEIELGYRLLQEYWRKGYATEASHRILYYAIKELQMKEVAAVVIEQNFKSRKVLEKLGFSYIKKGWYYGARCMYYLILSSTFDRINPQLPHPE